MDEDVDYMSDIFIASCLKGVNDVRPGLISNRKEQREHDLMKKKKSELNEKPKNINEYQAEVLENGLNKPISSSNKGFSMLQKMGFKSGMGLGKNSSGMVEPISLNIKKDKQGLGHKPKSKVSKIAVENRLDKLNENDFTAFHSKKIRNKKVDCDLRKSQKICQELDIKSNKIEPDTEWFWPPDPAVDGNEIHNSDTEEKELKNLEKTIEKQNKEVNDDYDNDQGLTNEEKLEIITKYLRNTYYYCIWCSIQYDDEKDLQECPGLTRDDH